MKNCQPHGILKDLVNRTSIGINFGFQAFYVIHRDILGVVLTQLYMAYQDRRIRSLCCTFPLAFESSYFQIPSPSHI